MNSAITKLIQKIQLIFFFFPIDRVKKLIALTLGLTGLFIHFIFLQLWFGITKLIQKNQLIFFFVNIYKFILLYLFLRNKTKFALYADFVFTKRANYTSTWGCAYIAIWYLIRKIFKVEIKGPNLKRKLSRHWSTTKRNVVRDHLKENKNKTKKMFHIYYIVGSTLW